MYLNEQTADNFESKRKLSQIRSNISSFSTDFDSLAVISLNSQTLDLNVVHFTRNFQAPLTETGTFSYISCSLRLKPNSSKSVVFIGRRRTYNGGVMQQRQRDVC
jgi:hypothetical protein